MDEYRATAASERGAARRRDELVLSRSGREVEGLCLEATRRGVTRRQFIERALLLGLSATTVGALAAACGGDEGAATPTPGVSPMEETLPSEVLLYNWTDYLNPVVKKGFQRKTGVRLHESFFASGEELLSKLTAGTSGYDVQIVTDYLVGMLRDRGLIEPLDMAHLPNFSYVGDQFRDPPYDDPAKQQGFRYSAPYFYGTTGYCQRLDSVPEPQTSWAPLFDSKYKGEIQMLDDEREGLAIALIFLGFSANSTSQSELKKARDLLIEQKPLLATYDSVNMKRAIADGSLTFVTTWDGDVLMALDQLKDRPEEAAQLHFVRPVEGYVRWTDAMVIPKGRNNRRAAHLLIDYLMDPKVAGQNASWVWYLSPIIPESWQYTDDFALTLKPTVEELSRSQQLTDVGDAATDYSDAWREVKSA